MAAFVGDDLIPGEPIKPFHDDGYVGYDLRLSSQRFDSYSFGADSSPANGSSGDVFGSRTAHNDLAPDTIFVGAGGYSPEQNGSEFVGDFGVGHGPILPPPTNMQPDEGFALREWRRLNVIRLEEKEKMEKEMLLQILQEAEDYKIEFYRKRSLAVENNKASNREKEKLYTTSREKFHADAEKNYWKAIAELIPNEVPTIEKWGKKEKEKEKEKPSIVVIQGPKPGKPTDLSRMRQILVKLKHNTPLHMKPKPPEAKEVKKDVKASGDVASTSAAPTLASATAATSAAPAGPLAASTVTG
ncbi:hypothetical protein SAY87_012246 [Trapa incisa]|uniref:Clathrin light chain n=1 Tax=Trapa incisa TaxID=236973 RepID=A0AAN7GXK6_9MYRT|nr:hypothetical protein SAY87_012246 [Trapa incisa]